MSKQAHSKGTTWTRVARYSRFIIAGAALLVAFGLSIEFNNRGLQFDLDRGGRLAEARTGGEGGGYNLAGAEVLNKVLLQMKEKYVDPTRISPDKMLVYGLDELQKAVPEIVVKFDRDLDDNPTQATIQVNDQTRTFRIGKFESLWEMSFKIKDVFRFVQDHLDESEDLKFSDIEYTTINGMLNTLDPHSVLLTPEVFKEMQTQTGGKFGGLGIVIGIRDGGLTVISPIEGTPASRAGIKAGDKITRIDDESTVNMSLNDAVGKMRGDPDTQITVWVGRDGWTSPKPITLTRAIIKIESVESHMLGSKVGYVKLKSFQANTYSDMRDQLEKLSKKSGGLNGLVLDLRENPGGLLDQAIKISDTFLRDGTIVSTVGFGNKLRDENKARKFGTEPDYPIVVLVDPGSASASEIVSGALKNLDRAIIVGDTTFGKGSVQVIYELVDGSALKLTIAQYLTPGDVSIQSVGITPDIKLIPVTIDDKGIDMVLSSNITREANLDSHLDHSSVRKGDKPAATVRFFQEREPDFDPNKLEDDKFKADYAINFAQEILRAAGTTWQRPDMLKKVEPALNKLAESQMDTITAELKKQNIDWSAGQSPEKPKLDVTLSTDKPNDLIPAGEKVKLTVTAKNTGDAPVFRLRASIEGSDSVFDEQEFVFGRIDPGQETSHTVEVDIPKHFQSREDHVSLKFGAMGAKTIADTNVVLKLKGVDRPHFAFNYLLDDSKGNGDGVAQVGEQITMRLNVTNTGKGAAGKTTAYLRNLSESALFLKEGRSETKAINAGDTHGFTFSFDVKELPEDDKPLKIEVEIYDETYKVLTSEELTLDVEAKADPVAKARGVFTTSKETPIRNGARPSAPAVAQAPANARLKVTGKTKDMVRVALDKDTQGWISASAGKLGGGAAPADPKVTAAVFRAAPQVSFSKPIYATSKGTIRLDGVASDDAGVKDYYIFVFHTDENNKVSVNKVAYKRGKGATLKIDSDVPLRAGMNRVRIYVRDTDDMVTDHTLFIHKR